METALDFHNLVYSHSHVNEPLFQANLSSRTIFSRFQGCFSSGVPLHTLYSVIYDSREEKAFKSSDHAAYEKAKYGVHQVIQGAKINYGKQLDNQFLTRGAGGIWQGLQSVSSYKSSAAPDDGPSSLTS